jgi:hypothetical protein
MAQELASADKTVCSGFAQAGFTPAGFTPAGFTPVGSVPRAISPEELLAALPSGASPVLRAALQADCCIHYTVAEGHCQGGGCGSGNCCYHAVGPGCGVDVYECLQHPCSFGDFSTGC